MSATRILIIDDDPTVIRTLTKVVAREGYEVAEAGTLAAGCASFSEQAPEVVLLDHQLPDGDALDFLRWVRERSAPAAVIVLTGHGSIPLAVEAIQAGAAQFLTKPVNLTSLVSLLSATVENLRGARREQARRYTENRGRPNPFEGSSEAIRQLEEMARSVARADVPILLQGETGTGKGVLARWLHEHSDRAEEPFVDLNCAGLSRELVESELFGHRKGAFTGATTDKVGLLEMAHRGTLFLDETGDLDLTVQPKLLKALEERRFRRLGEVHERSVDVRLLTASHKDLAALAARGSFRSDLLFRINTVTLELPPLRERAQDIEPIARAMLRSMGAGTAAGPVDLDEDALQKLTEHDWPGNARELRNALERALLFSPPGRIPAAALMLGTRRAAAVAPPEPGTRLAPSTGASLAEAERHHVLQVLKEHDGNVPQAASTLGLSRSSLYAKLKRWGIKPGEANA